VTILITTLSSISPTKSYPNNANNANNPQNFPTLPQNTGVDYNYNNPAGQSQSLLKKYKINIPKKPNRAPQKKMPTQTANAPNSLNSLVSQSIQLNDQFHNTLNNNTTTLTQQNMTFIQSQLPTLAQEINQSPYYTNNNNNNFANNNNNSTNNQSNNATYLQSLQQRQNDQQNRDRNRQNNQQGGSGNNNNGGSNNGQNQFQYQYYY